MTQKATIEKELKEIENEPEQNYTGCLFLFILIAGVITLQNSC